MERSKSWWKKILSKEILTGTVALFMLSFGNVAFAAIPDVNVQAQQTKKITGTVIDASGAPVIGATVMQKGTSNGTITDIDGNFTLDVPTGSIVVISYMGYVTQEITIGTQQNYFVTMQDDSKVIDEVVVTALGIKRSSKALGYAATELKGDELDANLINPVLALQGKVAGVDISASDGGMFGASKILIRGASTLGKNNQPIYVIDGIILDNAIVENDADWGSGGQNYGNELKNLNPDDFETVSVLKGAAATALYGSRGLNGAVVITTKSGKSKQGLGISFSQTLGFDCVTGQPDLQNDYAEGLFSGFLPGSNPYDSYDMFWGVPTDPNDPNSKVRPSYKKLLTFGGTGVSFGPSFSWLADNFDGLEWWDGSIINSRAYKNNFKDAYQTGFNTNTNVAVSGGNERTTFYTSLSYKHSNGTLPNNSFDRFSLLAKASHKISKDVELEAGVTFTNSTPRNAQPNIGENFIDGTWDRTYDAKYYRDKYKGEHGGLAAVAYGDKYAYVPGRGVWWNIWENEYKQKETVVRPNLKLTAQLTPWMKWITEGSLNYYYVNAESKVPGTGYRNQGGSYEIGSSTKEQTNLNSNLMFDTDINEDFHFNGFLRYEIFHNRYSAISTKTEGDLIMPNQYFLANGSKGYKTSAGVSGTKTIQSVAAQASFSWKDQLYLDITGRNDWSSSLVYSDGHGNYSYFYPSVGASWLIHETFRDKLPSWISFAKVRASWAQVGNDTEAYYINSAYSLASYTGVGNTSFYTTALPDKTYSKDLKPERKTSWEVGLDWRFLNNRVGLDFTYYKENTKNQIMSVDIPSVSGFKQALINAGNIQNQGIEVALNTTPVETKDFSWDLNFTYTKNKSKIVELSDLVANYIVLAGSPDYGNYRVGSVAKVGGEYGLLMSDAAPKRDYTYDDNGNITGGSGLPVLQYSNGRRMAFVQRAGKVEEIGTMMPKFLGSVNTAFRYKNITLRASFDMRFGGKVASYPSHYGTAYGYTKKSLAGRDAANGGVTWTSKWDGKTYNDGVIPNGVLSTGTVINQHDGSTYTVTKGAVSPNGETYAELYKKGVIEPTHASSYMYFTNSWGQGVVNDNWFVNLNYIAFRDLSLSYAFNKSLASKIGARNLSLTAAAHNLGYLLNSMPNRENPEAVAGTTAAEFRVRQFSGVTTNFTFTLNATF